MELSRRGAPLPTEVKAWVRKGGQLLQAKGSKFGDAVFYCRNGRRHWVSSLDWIERFGFAWPQDISQTTESVLRAFVPGPPVPIYWHADIQPATITTSAGIRHFIGSALMGTGLEVGAGSGPFPIPLDCRVFYGDRLSYEALLQEYHSQEGIYDVVPPDLIIELDSLQAFSDNSLDFIIACHVIEHTPNPLGAIVTAFSRLRPGGKLVLVVPDKERTFDCPRPLTPLHHVVEDFETPSEARDRGHFEEFYRLAMPVPDDQLQSTVADKVAEGYAIHYHVWNYQSFQELVQYALRLAPFKGVWFHPTMSHPELDIEFYCVLTK